MKIIEVREAHLVVEYDEENAGWERQSCARLMGERVGIHTFPKNGSDRRMRLSRITVTADHIKLVRASYTGWNQCEFGAAEVDPKRPYGNSSVYHDIAEIIGVEQDEEEEFTDEDYARMDRLHRETEICFQILISTLSLEEGGYVNTAERYCRAKWEKA